MHTYIQRDRERKRETERERRESWPSKSIGASSTDKANHGSKALKKIASVLNIHSFFLVIIP
jgi:hypothetical protein